MQRLEILTAFTNSLCHCPSHPFLGSLPPHSRIKDPCWSSCSSTRPGSALQMELHRSFPCLQNHKNVWSCSFPSVSKAAQRQHGDVTRTEPMLISRRSSASGSPAALGTRALTGARTESPKVMCGAGKRSCRHRGQSKQAGGAFTPVICSKLCNKGKFQGAEHRPVAASPPGSGALTRSWNCSLSSLHSRLMHFYGFSSLPPS